MNKKHNRLINEKSPYLLQHANNPVDWYPWCDEAFEKSKAENKPVFLSIGYSTCHWCHVMAHESFEDEEVAELMNDTFVCIKVDREERPDIDNIYMTVCQMMTGSGGWPLSIIMTPDRKPFFSATYIPKNSKYGKVGMLDFIPNLQTIWATRREEINRSADHISNALMDLSPVSADSSPDESIFATAYNALELSFDPLYGGFGHNLKFPMPNHLLFLLRYWKRTKSDNSLKMVLQTLDCMRKGGVYDHLGFGFHRYSTDSRWIVPHFEKMLYDQALLAMAYTEAFQVIGKKEYTQTVHEIFEYLIREMISPEGGFYSAQDADSEGEEGKFYLWTESEVRELLDGKTADIICQVFNINRNGNFIDSVTGKQSDENILYMQESVSELAQDLGIEDGKLEETINNAREILFNARAKRIRPQTDDKILTNWNGLVIVALAKAAQVFDCPQYCDMAKKCVDFILRYMLDSDYKLMHIYREGEAKGPSYIDDYAFFIWGLIELYETTFDASYLQTALNLNDYALKHFWDYKNNGFYFTSDDAETVILRQKEIHDSVTPSGNSVSMMNMMRLARITADTDMEKKASSIIAAFYDNVETNPSGYSYLLSAYDFVYGPCHEIFLAGDLNASDTQSMLKQIRKSFLPNKVIILRPGKEDSEILNIAGFIKTYQSIDSKATAYICSNYKCSLPTTDINEVMELLSQK